MRSQLLWEKQRYGTEHPHELGPSPGEQSHVGKWVDPRPPGIAAEPLDLKQTNHTMIPYLWVPPWLPPRDVGKGLYNSYLSESQMLFPTRALYHLGFISAQRHWASKQLKDNYFTWQVLFKHFFSPLLALSRGLRELREKNIWHVPVILFDIEGHVLHVYLPPGDFWCCNT